MYTLSVKSPAQYLIFDVLSLSNVCVVCGQLCVNRRRKEGGVMKTDLKATKRVSVKTELKRASQLGSSN